MNPYPVIAWRNILLENPGPDVTHSADASGYPFENISDWRDYTYWESALSNELFIKLDATVLPGMVMTIDTLAIAGHNLKTAGVQDLVFQWSDDNIAYYDCFSAIDPDSDRLIFRSFPAETHRYFKLTIPDGYSGTPRIGIFFAGVAMEIPAYPDSGFDPDAQMVEVAGQESRTGRLLGVAERFRRREIKVSWSRIPASFINGQWGPFFAEHGAMPFFFAWDPDGRPEEAYLVRLAQPQLEAPYEKAFRSLSLQMTGVVE